MCYYYAFSARGAYWVEWICCLCSPLFSLIGVQASSTTLSALTFIPLRPSSFFTALSSYLPGGDRGYAPCQAVAESLDSYCLATWSYTSSFLDGACSFHTSFDDCGATGPSTEPPRPAFPFFTSSSLSKLFRFSISFFLLSICYFNRRAFLSV